MSNSPVSPWEPPANRDADAPLHGMLELTPVLYWEADAELRFTALGGMALRTMGLSPEPHLGRPIGEFFCGEEVRRAHHAALAGRASSFDAALHRRELHVTIRPWTGPDGAVAGVAGLAIDLTERLFAERALRLSEHGYRTLIEDAPYAMCRCTTGGELLQVNRAMNEMLGYCDDAATELLLLDLPQIFTPAGSFESFRASLHAGGSRSGTDCGWRRRDGVEIQVRVTGRMLRDASGALEYLDIFAEDVTEKKRLEAELSDAQRMQAIGQLAGGVAHDFNNLLTVIGGQVELLLEVATDPDTRERLDDVKQAAERAADLTRQLLAFGRRQLLRSKVVDINTVIGKLMGMMHRLIRENIDLRFVPCDSLATVVADTGEMERVLLNLVVNAQDAMASGGAVVIGTAKVAIAETALGGAETPKPGNYVLITVRDTGLGMDRATRARAFEPFFTTKAPGEGTGLGLAVAYGIIRQSGGYITLDSEPGSGTLVSIYLPAVVETAADTPAVARSGELRGGDETILIAEDDRAIRVLISRMLETLGYVVLSAPDGAAALELARRHPGRIHLLLSDVIMPALGGHELAAQLKVEKPDLKVVFISGYAGGRLADFDAAEVCFIQKPVAMESLASTIRSVLDGCLP